MPTTFNELDTIAPGTVLPNGTGAVCVASAPAGQGAAVVLAVRADSPTPWVTWLYPLGRPDQTYWGDYHTTFGDAIKSYEERRKG